MSAPHDWQRWFDEHAAALVLLARQFCASRADAEDAVQEAFFRTWRRRAEVEDAVAYLYAATRTAAIDLSRKRQRDRRHESEAAEVAGSRGASPSLVARIEDDEWRRLVELALGRLPAEQREVLVMKVWGNLTFAQVALALAISPNTAASRYRYAMGALRKSLSEDHSHER